MVINEYRKTALEASNASNLSKRKAWPLKVNFNYTPPASNSKKFGPYRRLKEHIQDQVRYFTVLDDFELYRILQGVENGDVSPFWRSIVTEFWNAKKQNKIITEVTIGGGGALENW